MNTTEYIYLIAQLLCIASITIWACKVAIRLSNQSYSFLYIFGRALFWNDYEPYLWLRRHRIYLDYTIQIIGLLFTDVALISQISDQSVFTKPWTFFVGTLLIAWSTMRTQDYIKDTTKN